MAEERVAVSSGSDYTVFDTPWGTGNPMILDPYGRVVAETWAAGEAIVTADLELVPLSTGRRWFRGAARSSTASSPAAPTKSSTREPRASPRSR